MNFYDKVNGLCWQKGISITTLAVTLGFSKGSPTGWKNTEATPRASTVKKIADYFGVSVDYFLEENNEPVKAATPVSTPATADEYTDEEKRIIAAYRALSAGMQEYMLETVEKLADVDKGKKINRA